MRHVNVTELRNHLPQYLSSLQQGSELLITSHGEVIARLLPPTDRRAEARKKLEAMRKHCKVHDVVAPIGEHWDVEK